MTDPLVALMNSAETDPLLKMLKGWMGDPLVEAIRGGDGGYQRGMVLPVARKKLDDGSLGDLEFAVPQLAINYLQSAMLPGEVYSGETQVFDPETGHVSQYVIDRTADIADIAPMSAFGYGATTMLKGGKLYDPTATYIPGGPRAATADQRMLKKAKKMEKAGSAMREIQDATGWYKLGDGKWRFDIPDDAMKFKPDAPQLHDALEHARIALDEPNLTNADIPNLEPWQHEILRRYQRVELDPMRRLEDVIEHPDFFEAYPEARDWQVGWMEEPGGAFNPETGQIRIGHLRDDDMNFVPTKKMRREHFDPEMATIHELAHGVQKMEGFSEGAYPGKFNKVGEAAAAVDNALDRKRGAIALRIDKVNDALASAEPDDILPLQYMRDRLVRDMKRQTRKKDALKEKFAPFEAYQRALGEAEARSHQIYEAHRRMGDILPGETRADAIKRIEGLDIYDPSQVSTSVDDWLIEALKQADPGDRAVSGMGYAGKYSTEPGPPEMVAGWGPQGPFMQEVPGPSELIKVVQGSLNDFTERLYDKDLDLPLSIGKPDWRMFAGPNARTADAAALMKATRMAEQGADPRVIWKETGWLRGKDGKWRFEIDDSAAKVRPDAPQAKTRKQHYAETVGPEHADTPVYDLPYEGGLREAWGEKMDALQKPRSLEDILDHPELYEAYPDLRHVRTEWIPDESGSYGSYDDGARRIEARSMGKGENPVRDLSGPEAPLLHEVSHAIQSREGMTKGANTGMYDSVYPVKWEAWADIDDAISALKKRVIEIEAEWIPAKTAKELRAIDRELWSVIEDIEELRALKRRLNSEYDNLPGYLNDEGEGFARLAEYRRNMTAAERRAEFPGDTLAKAKAKMTDLRPDSGWNWAPESLDDLDAGVEARKVRLKKELPVSIRMIRRAKEKAQAEALKRGKRKKRFPRGTQNLPVILD